MSGTPANGPALSCRPPVNVPRTDRRPPARVAYRCGRPAAGAPPRTPGWRPVSSNALLGGGLSPYRSPPPSPPARAGTLPTRTTGSLESSLAPPPAGPRAARRRARARGQRRGNSRGRLNGLASSAAPAGLDSQDQRSPRGLGEPKGKAWSQARLLAPRNRRANLLERRTSFGRRRYERAVCRRAKSEGERRWRLEEPGSEVLGR